METTTIQNSELQKEFVAPKSKEDFPEGQTKIEHTYENGNAVVFLLLKSGEVARIREGSGEEVERAEIECGENKEKYMASMMSSCVTVNGETINMYDFAKRFKMKDYLMIKTEFAQLNF